MSKQACVHPRQGLLPRDWPAVDCAHESVTVGGPLSSALRQGQDCSQDVAGCNGSLPLTCRDAFGKQKLQVARGQLQATDHRLECSTRHIWARGPSTGSICWGVMPKLFMS